MMGTFYDDNSIKEFRKKYRVGVVLHRLFYTFTIIVFLIGIVPYRWDTFSFFDAERNFHYFFGIYYAINALIALFIIVALIYGIPFVLKRIMKEKHVEFLVAKRNRNILSSEKTKKAKAILSIVIVVIGVFNILFSLGNIDSIKVTDTGFYVQNRTLFRSTVEEYTFDYFYNHRIIVNNRSVYFYETGRTEDGGSFIRRGESTLYFGRYSPHLRQLFSVLDQKTDGQYNLLETITNLMAFG